MKKQKFWTRVRNVFRPDKNNGLTNEEIAHLNQLKDKKDFQDLLFEPIQLYQLLCKRYTTTEVMRWICEMVEFEGDELDESSQTMEFLTQLNYVAHKQQWDKMQNLFALVQEVGEVFKASKSKFAEKSMANIKGAELLRRYPTLEGPIDAPKYFVQTSLQYTPVRDEPVIQENSNKVIESEQKKIKSTPVIKYGYKHPLAKAKIY